MAGLLSASLLAELQANSRSAFAVCTIVLPGGVSLRIAAAPIAVAAAGQYAGIVTRWGPIERMLSDRDGGLQFPSTFVEFHDVDQTFGKAIATSGIEAMRGAAFAIAVGSGNVAVANWFSAFVGTVDDVEMVSPFVWHVAAQSNQQQLREGFFPKTPILQSDFPNVSDKALYAQRVPLIYGVHDSRGNGDTGAVPCPYVDTVGKRYLVGQGWVSAIDRVYSAGVLKTVTVDYTITRPTINGRLYTMIVFLSDQGTNAVTADVTGYESTGTGGGENYLTGTDVLAHILTNFIYGDYQFGSWAATTSNINAASFAAAQTILTTLGIDKVSMRFGGAEKTRGADAVSAWCRTLGVDAFWTGFGKLALAFNNPSDATVYYDDPRLFRYDRDELQPLGLKWDRSRLATRILASFLFSSASGQYTQKLEVRDASASEDVQAPLDLLMSYRSLL